MRMPWPAAVAGVAVAAVGAAGLIRGAVPQSAPAPASTSSNPIVVANAYVRPPVPPTRNAAGTEVRNSHEMRREAHELRQGARPIRVA